ncbi:undecaprenyldiphospho-muramoylpentapeptide beta-N-acetylglucosaminyltransferase [Ahrensia marina]|uniref:UDP-N-acetylglucosamine--N-acetylmuramyl-(pentapeptide) pyrophosphoryl-undecaprenol N-acetylglucosamine transferase n=1 Tax=Ahrensia marina TaxID=1514904 RepID=A0A0N0E8X7_9HYPH|nr:undecaprenyldiphospho-muramoylpentapeptide beta-N-acetylglucosaminyltransferase [Ahrensia marina]KPB02871.1 UDP-diphospho-muramoylpentapeptide beta-N-acetylglucosaminyltransferase [Ahrensia marina]
MTKGVILLSAGGTGGHLFPAEALAHELNKRGWTIHLATDKRAQQYTANFPALQTHVIDAASPSGVNPIKIVKAVLTLMKGMVTSKRLIGDLKPRAVIGFGGYPTVPPLIAASGKMPTMIHEQNAVAGRANKMLAKRVTLIAGGFLKAKGEFADKIVETGNPVRPAVKEASEKAYAPIGKTGPINLVIFGGSQGAQFFSKTIPAALAKMPESLRKRIHLTQQARPEDEDEARAAYATLGVKADVSPFFSDLPRRISDAHLVMARSGASTVSEIAAIGRPAIFVPYPHALDHDQAANAAALEAVGGAKVMRQGDLDADIIAREFEQLIQSPDVLAKMAAAAKAAGKPRADILLADLTEAIASGKTVAELKTTQP